MNDFFDIYLIKGFAKKPNSTKRPEINVNVEQTARQKRVRGRLREGCSLFTPVFLIEWPLTRLKTQAGQEYPDPQYQTAEIMAYNYAFIQLFGDYNSTVGGEYWTNALGRFYWRSDLRQISATLFELSLEVDPLATYRDEIGESYQYIVRSALGSYSIPDSTLPTRLNRTVTSAKGGKLFGDASCQVVVVAGADTSTGVANVIAGASLLGLPSFWVDDVGNEPTDEQWESMNVYQSIRGAYTLPLKASELTTINVTLNLGKFHTREPLIAISDESSVTKSTSVIAPPHPQAKTYPFLSSNSYSDYRLFVPFLGVIPVSAGLIPSSETINITATCDPLSGTANIRVSFGEDASLIQSATVTIAGYLGYGGAIGNSATASAVGQATERGAIISGVGGVLGAGAGLAAGVATGGVALVAGAIGAGLAATASVAGMANALATNGVNTSIASAQNSVSTVSGGGNRFEGSRSVMITGSFITIASGATVTGKPDCTIRKVSEAVGEDDSFMTVANPHLDIEGADISELTLIYQSMNGGFYYE